MSAYTVRHSEPADAEAIHRIVSDERAFANMLGLPCPSLQQRKDSFAKHGPDFVQLVALAPGGEPVGVLALIPSPRPRLAASAELGIGVRHDWQGRGVGGALMAAMTDLADNWLGLRRIELTVFPDNLAGQALYRRFGFVEEARLRAYALRRGAYHDVLAMARLHPGWRASA
ncbi:GNAT family N-acetyltransferase [Xenophilus sp. AP218F]|nr:GNAT family N-acetyltransferase [Xenophilus sp. AP218F]